MRETSEQPGKRERILDAAIAAFSRHGFYRTRIRDIARAAGVADGTVYLYFANKEDLLPAIFEEVMKPYLADLKVELARLPDPCDKLHKLMEMHLHRLGRDRGLATVFQVELRHATRFMEIYAHGYLHDYLKIIQEILDAGRADGCLRENLDTAQASSAIFGMLDEAVTAWVVRGGEGNLSDRIDGLHDLVVHGLACTPADEAPPAGGTPPA